MLKFLSKVRFEFNARDPRIGSCMEFLAQCNTRKAKESNPACQILVKRRVDDIPPKIGVTFVNGVEEVFDGTTVSVQTLRNLISEKSQLLETEQRFRQAGHEWPVIIPEEELQQPVPAAKHSSDEAANKQTKENRRVRRDISEAQISVRILHWSM
ncbi:uncharacterized protein LOC110622263 [Manihot esculenta]|uniref:Large ribosomal subunit protein mL53 n=1 Tax=Manihot esculenta TaxID=3983 RepID=A0A2C9V8B9_MANES|nr:uncharacterized protein LOC110622263 [Manihot esculenta]OAY40849.1 hypothetical protein MANES_09G054100v8 [Manihot esculenta]